MPLLARSPSTNRKYPPLPVDKLEEEINRRMADDNKLFREEFNVSASAPALRPRGLPSIWGLGCGSRGFLQGLSSGRAGSVPVSAVRVDKLLALMLTAEKREFLANSSSELRFPGVRSDPGCLGGLPELPCSLVASQALPPISQSSWL